MITTIEAWMDSFSIPRTRDFETVNLYSSLIEEELTELENAYMATRSEAELKEAADLIWVAVAKVLALGYTPTEIIQALANVWVSNMSKLCTDPARVDQYIKDNDLVGKAVVEEIQPGKYVARDVATGKILKGPAYEPAKINLNEYEYTHHKGRTPDNG